MADLTPAWGARLTASSDAHVTVRIEEDLPTLPPTPAFVTDDTAFGPWRDREDMADVADCLRRLRAPRYKRDGARNQP